MLLYVWVWLQHGSLRESCFQMREEELCGVDDVVRDDEVTAEVVGRAQLRQGQMHLVHAEMDRETKVETERERASETMREEEIGREIGREGWGAGQYP